MSYHFWSVPLIFASQILLTCGSDDTSGLGNPFQTTGDEAPPLGTAPRSSGLDTVRLSGSVVSAFGVSVDGVSYEDSEDFFTQELGRLPEKAVAAGYAGWDIAFSAVVGFSDLARGMMVYISPVGRTGYSGQASVGSDGRFEVVLNPKATDASYNIRAVKRVSVTLARAGESRTFCYNFSAVEKNVEFNQLSKPVVLDTFTTRLTSYSCDTPETTGSVSLPSTSQSATTSIAGTLTSTVLPASSAALAQVGLGDSPWKVVQAFGDPESIVRPFALSYFQSGFDFAWKYSRIPGSSFVGSCMLKFQSQMLISYELCPASRIRFFADDASIAVRPAERLVSGDSESSVLSKWGIPSVVSFNNTQDESNWEFNQTHLTNDFCRLKFKMGSLQSYSSGCKFAFLAHWTFL